MRRMVLPLLLALPLSGCGVASASPYDSTDPIQCMTVFGVTSAAARNGPLANELNARILYIAQANGGAEWLRQVTAPSRQMAASFEAAADKEPVLELFEECRDRQDADPAFRAAGPALLAEARRITPGAR